MRSPRLPRVLSRLPSAIAIALGALVLAVGAPASAAAGPVTSGPVTSGPVTSGPVTSSPPRVAMDAPPGGPPPAATWAWPVAAPHPVVRPYLAPPTPYGAGHRGIDIGATEGAPVLAPDDGIVHFVGVVVDRPVLSIEHAGGILSSFEPVVSDLHAGDAVHRGEVVGTLAAGHCTSTVCLHLGARVDGQYVNPLTFLGGVPRAVLYPTRAP